MLAAKKLSGGPELLYDEGDGEGNWEPGQNEENAVQDHTKNSDHLYAYTENDDVFWVTSEPYDLTEIDIIEVEWEGETDGSEYRGIAVDPTQTYQDLFGAEKYSYEQGSGAFSRQTQQIDVSIRSGEYYIGVHIYSNNGSFGEYKLYRVERAP